jgi:hypothetical protein
MHGHAQRAFYSSFEIESPQDELALLRRVSSLQSVGVTVFQAARNDPAYPGFQVILGAGCYTTAQLQGVGVLDNQISSLEVPAGYRIALYDLDAFAGNSTVVNTTAFTLVPLGFNDVASSVCVQYCLEGERYAAIF